MEAHKLFLVTGASGSGKTTAVKRFAELEPDGLEFCYFDSIGVPSNEEMIQEFGSGENWRKVNTQAWIQKIQSEYLSNIDVIFDGQMRPSFIEEVCKAGNLRSYEVILFDCDNATRTKRLIERNHAELANQQMMNWAKYLRNECKEFGYKIIDNSKMTVDEGVQALREIVGK
jgi:dephospho-CoA kinase